MSKKKAAPRKPRDSQKSIKGMEPDYIKELCTASRVYADARDERQKLLAAEVNLKEVLVELMEKNKKKIYLSKHGLVTEITEGKVKVKVAKQQKPEQPF